MTDFSVTGDFQTFMRCPQKWQLTSLNRQGLEPIMKAPALALGTLIHKTIEVWSNQLYVQGLAPRDPDADPLSIYTEQANTALQNIVLKYRAQVGANPSGAELLGVTQAINLGKAMITNYKSYWETPVPSNLRLVKAEQALVVPIPNSPHRLKMRLDGLLYDSMNDFYLIRENKTFGVHPSVLELSRNFQFLCYIWGAKALFGVDVRGIAYDGLWKRESIYRTDAKTQKQVPRKRRDGTAYTQDDLFLRTTLIRSPKELDSLAPILAMQAERMASFNPDTDMYRVVPPVKGCVLDDKSNIPLCDAIWRGENTDLIMRQYTHREDESEYDIASIEDDEE